MGEEERRELIARQRSALYGEGPYPEAGFDDSGAPGPGTQGSGSQSAVGLRGHSPLAFDLFHAQASQGEGVGQQQEPQSATSQAPGQQRSRANSTSSPSSNPTDRKSVV